MKKKEENKPEIELSEETQFDILSKKIICMFHRKSLFTRLAITDYEGWIRGQGDKVRMVDRTELIIDRAIPIKDDPDPVIFEDIIMIDLVTTRIAKELKEQVEEVILKADDALATLHDSMVLSGEVPPQHVHGRLYFVGQIVPMGGFEIKGYGMKFVYGFKIG